MQKFGLDSLQSQKHSALGFEIIKEQASTLGLAGRKLRLSILKFERAKTDGFPEGNADILLQEISKNFYGLMLQREFIGFVEGNMEWLTKYYSIPAETMSMLGSIEGAK